MEYTKNDIKVKAAELRAAALRSGIELSHGRALNDAAKSCGFASWNAACGMLRDEAASAPALSAEKGKRTPERHAEPPGRSATHTLPALPPLVLGFYSLADARRVDGNDWPTTYLVASEREPGPKADESSNIRFLRAKRNGLLIGESTVSVWYYGHTGGSPNEMYRIHSALYEYEGEVILRAAWQPVVSGELCGPVYIAAWKSSDDWRHGMDVWCGRHATCEALEALLADVNQRAPKN